MSVFHALEIAGRPRDVLGFVDDGANDSRGTVLGLPVLGDAAWLDGRAGQVEILITVGAPRIRRALALRLSAQGHRFATVVHPTAVMTPWVQVGQGTLVMAGCTFTVDTVVGSHAVLNPGCTLAHDVHVGDFVYLSPGVHLAGRVSVADGAYLGVGATVLPSCRIGAGSLVGGGAVVTKDVPADRVVAGVPARDLRAMDEPWEGHDSQP